MFWGVIRVCREKLIRFLRERERKRERCTHTHTQLMAVGFNLVDRLLHPTTSWWWAFLFSHLLYIYAKTTPDDESMIYIYFYV